MLLQTRTASGLSSLLVALCVACAPRVNARRGPGAPLPSLQGEASLLAKWAVLDGTALSSTNAATLFDALERLRPDFLNGQFSLPSTERAVAPSVYLNGIFAGDLSALNTIPLDAVSEVRLLRPRQARDWLGAYCRCEGGVISVSTRPTRDRW